MIELTIKQAIERSVTVQERYRLYVIRDGETVFYVGQSMNAYNRILSHLGDNQGGCASQVGEFIIANAPLSGNWLFQMYTVEDSRPFVLEYRKQLPDDNRTFYDAWDNPYNVDDAEMAMIKLLRPCLNSAMNIDASPIPEKYVNPFARKAFNPRAAALSKLFGFK